MRMRERRGNDGGTLRGMGTRATWAAAILAALLMLAATTASGQTSSPPSLPETDGGYGQAPPANEQGPLPPPSIEEIDEWIEAGMARWDVPGLGLAIVYDVESYLSTGYGVRETGKSEPVDGGTLFSIGSCSKAFGAATLAALAEDGRLSWDDRIIDHLPWFRLHDPWPTQEIRVRDIVTHRVGTGSNQPLRPLSRDRRDYLGRLPHTEPVHTFRDRYGYTNDMLILTGALAEAVSGMKWDALARQKLWNPLGMASTTSRMDIANASRNHAEPHAFVERRFAGNAATTGMPLEPVPWQYPDDLSVPSGGVISSADDMTEWMKFHLGSHPAAPLQKSSVELMHVPHTVILRPSSWMPFEGTGAYAMGWSTGRFGDVTTVGHGGNALGFNCSIALAPEHGFGVWANSNRNSELPWVVTKWAVARFLGGEDMRSRDWHAEHESDIADANRRAFEAEAARQAARLDQGPSLPLEAFAGRYRNGYAGELVIRVSDGAEPALMPAEGRVGRWDATPGVNERREIASDAPGSEARAPGGSAGMPTTEGGPAPSRQGAGIAASSAQIMLVAELDGRERPLRLPLEHWHLNQFDAWYGDIRIGVSFTLDDMAQVVGVNMDYYGSFDRTP